MTVKKNAEPSGLAQFKWDEELQGIILGSFYWGYVLTHIPGGILSEKFGGKHLLGFGIVSTAILTILTPFVINWGGSTGLIALRFIEGICEGPTFPALSAIFAIWVPLKERGKLGAFVFAGSEFGAIIGTALSGLIIGAFDSWESVFYIFGVIAIIWFILFELVCYNDPETHPFIKESEKEYLANEIGSLSRDKSLAPTPWRALLSNPAVLALVFAQMGHDFGYYILFTDLPKYMSDVLEFSVEENGLFSALPFLLLWICSLLMGAICDWMISKGWISTTNTRKMYNGIASVCPAFILIAASYAGKHRALVVTLFSIAVASMAGFFPSIKVNPLDLAPNYAGSVMAVVNGMGSLTGIIGPYLVGVLTPNTTVLEWRIVFWITFVVFNVTNFIYLIFASGEKQAFNDTK